jgi:hypothetical protein
MPLKFGNKLATFKTNLGTEMRPEINSNIIPQYRHDDILKNIILISDLLKLCFEHGA